MGWLSDAWDTIVDVAEEIPIVNGVVFGVEAIVEGAPGFFEEVGDVLSSPIDTVIDGAEFVGEALAGFGALVLSPVAIAGDVIGGVTEFAGEAIDTVTFGGASWVMDQVDDYVLDTVDWATGGAVDIDFDDGAFSVDLGMNELASVGFSIGEQGFTADGYVAGLGAGVGMVKDEGFSVDLKADLPFMDEVGVGLGLDLDEGGDDAFFLDVDTHVLRGDAPSDAPVEEVPVDAARELPPDLVEAMPAENADGIAQFAEVPSVQEIAPDIDDEFVSDVGAVDAVAQTADDIWDDLG